MPKRSTPRAEAKGRDTDPDELAQNPKRDTYVDEGPSTGARSIEGLDFDDVGPTHSGEHDVLDAAPPPGEHDLDALSGPAIGDAIDGRYVIERVIGRGASGTVFEASHQVIGKRLAIKTLHPQMATSTVAVQRLFREARISASLRHPNVIEVYDAGRDGDLYYLAMELLEGRPLSAYLAEGAPHSGAELARIFLAIMDGVAAVHGAGVVHRDLKPDNVFMIRDEEGALVPKVLDFGVSKLYEPGRQQLTSLGMTMGTPFYMAPEQVTDSREVDARADVYSLGVMLYEALGGQVPYGGESLLEIFTRSLEGRPAPLRELRPDVPPSLEALVARAMCANRGARYEDVRAMRAALAAVTFDGSDRAQEWADKSEPWMLDPSGGHHPSFQHSGASPLESSPTHVASLAGGSTVQLDSSKLRALTSEGRERAKTVEMQPAPPRGGTVEMAPPDARRSPPVGALIAIGVVAVLLLGATFVGLLFALLAS